MSRIKILYIGMSSNLGGIETYLINLYRNIDFKKFQLEFLSFEDDKICFYEEILKHSNIYCIPSRIKNYIKYMEELKYLFKNKKFDYIHVNLMDFSCFEPILIAQKYSNAKIILHSHTANKNIKSIKTKILSKIGEKLLLKNEDYIKLACSESAGKNFFDNFKNKEFYVFNNGINIEDFIYDKTSRDSIRKQLNIKDADKVIGNVARFVDEKNHKFILKIFEKILKEDANFKLLLIGEGKLKKKIISIAKRKKIYNNIIFVSIVDNVQQYLCAMDVFFFPSKHEGLGIALVEAQANGLECIMTNSLPQELNISNRIKRLDLKKDSYDIWCKEIIEKKDYNREINLKEFEKYNLKNTAIILEKMYETNLGE